MCFFFGFYHEACACALHIVYTRWSLFCIWFVFFVCVGNSMLLRCDAKGCKPFWTTVWQMTWALLFLHIVSNILVLCWTEPFAAAQCSLQLCHHHYSHWNSWIFPSEMKTFWNHLYCMCSFCYFFFFSQLFALFAESIHILLVDVCVCPVGKMPIEVLQWKGGQMKLKQLAHSNKKQQKL